MMLENKFFIPTWKYVVDMTYKEFELFCLNMLNEQFKDTTGYKVEYDKKANAYDGDYQIDIYIEFTQGLIKIKTLVECKHYKESVKRERVELLRGRLDSLGYNKGILISSSEFQSGAIKYASEHGIALIQIIDAVDKSDLMMAQVNVIMNSIPEYKRYNYGQKYIGVMQSQDNGIHCDYLTFKNQKLNEFLIK